MIAGAQPLVLFDLDGTLVDSAADIAQAADSAIGDVGLPRRGIERIRTYIGNGAERLIHRALTDQMHGSAPLELFERAYARFLVHYAAGLVDQTRPYPGVVETLEALRANGYTLGCVTNKPACFTLPLLAQLGLARYFTVTLSGDSLPTRKPDPQPLWHAARVCRATPITTTVVGDSLNDLKAAKAAGMKVICVAYGYSANEDLAAHRPDALVTRMADILPILGA